MVDMDRGPKSSQAEKQGTGRAERTPENTTDKSVNNSANLDKAEMTMRDSAMMNETLTRAIRGDDDALCAILRSLDSDLRFHIGRNIGAQHRHEIEVDDVLQVTYMEVFLHIRRFRHHGIEAFRSWLWQTADNNIRDALRNLNAARRPPPGKRITPEDRDDSYVDLLMQMGGTHSTPSKFMARKEARRVMNDAINRLPSDYATVVRLCDLDGYTSSQAAAAMHRSEAAVRMLRARAHDRLMEIVGSVLTP